MPARNRRKRMCHNTNIAGMTVKLGKAEGMNVRTCQFLWVVSSNLPHPVPMLGIVRKEEFDTLRNKNPRKGEEKEIERNLAHRLDIAQINGRIKFISIKSHPIVIVVQQSAQPIDQTLCSSGRITIIRRIA